MADLPDEMISHIMNYMDLLSLSRFIVCRRIFTINDRYELLMSKSFAVPINELILYDSLNVLKYRHEREDIKILIYNIWMTEKQPNIKCIKYMIDNGLIIDSSYLIFMWDDGDTTDYDKTKPLKVFNYLSFIVFCEVLDVDDEYIKKFKLFVGIN